MRPAEPHPDELVEEDDQVADAAAGQAPAAAPFPPHPQPARPERASAVVIDWQQTTVSVSMNLNRLEAMRQCGRQARDRVQGRLLAARDECLAGAEFAEVLRLRQHDGEAGRLLALSRALLGKAETDHRVATVAGEKSARTSQLWANVEKARAALGNAEAATAAISAALARAEAAAADGLRAAIAAAWGAEHQEILSRRRELQDNLLRAVRPILEALSAEDAASSELGRPEVRNRYTLLPAGAGG
jgi:hypothetical protein